MDTPYTVNPYRPSADATREAMKKAHTCATPELARNCAICQERAAAAVAQQQMADGEIIVTLPTEATARKDIPLATGLLDYFPAALAAVAELSKKGNDQHNPGEPLHWARGKSMDHADCLMRHLIDRGKIDTDGLSHTVKVAWRALALLQEEMEAQGAPLPRGARIAGAHHG